jgi:hypothetical protein
MMGDSLYKVEAKFSIMNFLLEHNVSKVACCNSYLTPNLQNVPQLEMFVQESSTILTPKIPWDQKLVDCSLGSLCEEK